MIGTGKSLDAVSNGRIKIYKASIDVIRNDPSILFRGCLDDRSSDELTRALFEKGLIKEGKHITHYQNYLIQVLIVTGLPGLLLAASFSILLVIKSVKSFFCCGEKLSLPHKTLVLPIAASMAYMMFEIGLFTTTDLRTLFFFLMSGIFAGGYYDSVLQNSEMLNSREKELCATQENGGEGFPTIIGGRSFRVCSTTLLCNFRKRASRHHSKCRSMWKYWATKA